jgi:uncharacterized protein (TIGR03663 family)
MSKKVDRHLLDTPILGIWHINLEVALYILLAIVAVAACFYNLGARTESHDESLHCLYSWKLYNGEGYEHNPMMHGPFLFHINALVYFLLGTSDFTTRVSTATFGVILVLLPILLRKELGRMGALILSALTLISPSTLYYARYIRNDVYMMVWAMLMTISLFRYLESRKPGWIYLGVAAVVLAVCTKETSYITGFIGLTYLVILFIQQMFSPKNARRAYILGGVLLVVLLLGMVALNAYATTLPEQPAGGTEQAGGGVTRQQVQRVIEILILVVGVLLCMLLGSILIRRDESLKAPLRLISAYAMAIVTLMVFAAAAGGLAWLIVSQLPENVLTPAVFVAVQVIAVAVAVSGSVYGWWLMLRSAHRQGWLPEAFQDKVLYIAVGLAVVIFTLLYTTFFTNPKGLGTGTFGAIAYWLAQQEVKRAGQPWYYYMVIAPLYEFVPIGFGLLAMAYYFLTGKVDRRREAAGLPEEAEHPSPPFVSYVVFWALSAWLIYSWAGEKMPWMMVHIVQPMIILTARFADDILSGVDWRRVWQQGGALLAVLVPIVLFAAGMVIGLPLFGQAFHGMSLNDLNDTSKWLSALLIGGGLAYVAFRIARGLGTATTWRVVFATALVIGSLFTIRFAWMANYINYDTAKEFLVYAHASPDVKQTVNEIKEISRRLYGDEHSIKFSYSSDATWPFEWYFDTEFPNRVFFGREPSRETTDMPVLVVGREEIAKVEPFLGQRYYRFDRKLVWWPHQDYYMGLSFAMPSEENRQPGKHYLLLDLQDPEFRKEFWDILFYRRYKQSLADWEPSHPFAFYVRKDVAAQLWDYGVVPTAVDLGEEDDTYSQTQEGWTAVSILGGRQGSGEGMMDNPRNVAIGPDGSIYVADSGNHRIQKYSADGQLLTTWGHMCKMLEGLQGCQSPDGAGGFYDPWGIAVDGDGFVYVADTWNHRIQKFTADGEFVTMWGTYGVADSAVGGQGMFWGPRAVAVDADGLVYVSDTGNKRIQAFTSDGAFVTQWGGKGTLDGKLDEPVGIAIAPDGRAFVADTWNQRIQVFDAQHYFLSAWAVDSWYGQSLVNKPYLALDARGRVYATDPEMYRVLVFDENGQFLTSLGQYGNDDQSFMLPTGIAIDAQGYIWIADTTNHRVMKFPPVD